MRARILVGAVFLAALASAPGAQANFPGKNGLIAFSISPTGGPSDLWTVKPDGRGRHQLTRTRTFSETDPSFSADGRKIAFLWTAKNGRTQGVGVMSANGSGIKHLTSGPITALWSRPAWSPDGQSVYFSRTVGAIGAEQIWRISARGGTPQQLTNATTARDPLTSGDRTHLLFQLEDESTGQSGTALSGLDATAPVFTGIQRHADDWSPDGKRALFVFGHDIYSTALDGSDRRRLDSLPNFDSGETYSPDGKKFVWYNAGKDDLMLANVGGSHVRRLMHGRGHEVDPAWQPR